MVTPGYSSSDVFVVGGGPAGLAAAIACRQRGFDVTVADCAVPPIDKACGEGLMPDSLDDLAALGVTLDGSRLGAFRGIRFAGECGSVAADFPRGVGAGVRRTLLHSALIERAASLGVNMLWGARIAGIRSDAVLVNGDAVPCRWIIGADGQNSVVRKWAGLAAGRERDLRIALRRHYRASGWSNYVEIFWGDHGQAYVTPISPDEVCVAVIFRRRPASFEAALADFPELRERLARGVPSSDVRGAVTVTRTLRSVVRDNVALVGEASGSVDAVTGEGMALGFRQAAALAAALAGHNLAPYSAAHRRIGMLPARMAATMLLMDKSGWIRDRALRVFQGRPTLFARLLSLHVGEARFDASTAAGFLQLGWRMLTA